MKPTVVALDETGADVELPLEVELPQLTSAIIDIALPPTAPIILRSLDLKCIWDSS